MRQDAASFVLDVLYLVLSALMLAVSGILLWIGHVGIAALSLVAVWLGIECVRYRLKVARYYLGRRW